METRSAEILSALIAMVISISMFTTTDSAIIMQVMNASRALPEWAIINLSCATLCVFAAITGRIQKAARFMSGCLWGTIILIFASFQQFLPFFWIAVVMFSFDIYLVTFKGRSWMKRGNS